MTLPLRVLGDRILVKPDINANAPETTESGIVLAQSLAAAVSGADPTKSLHRGTVVAVGRPRHPRAEEAEMLAAVLVKRESPNWVEDVAAGRLLRDLVRREPCCAVDDDVLFSHDAGQEVTIAGDTYVLLKEDELLAIVEPEKEEAHV